MTKTAAIVGASLGGLVAAAELSTKGFKVSVFESSTSISGLYQRVSTPFGDQELGMHVAYVNDRQLSLLRGIFGKDSLVAWSGTSVDIGGNRFRGTNNFGSVYPDARLHPSLHLIQRQILEVGKHVLPGNDAMSALLNRFGHVAATEIYLPILEKLWGLPATSLASGAINCFYDLRRIVAWDKPQTDVLKDDPSLDAVIANPNQHQPKALPFGGRNAARLTATLAQLEDRVLEWSRNANVTIELGAPVAIDGDRVTIGDSHVDEHFDHLLICTPIHSLRAPETKNLSFATLSVSYFLLDNFHPGLFPSYYLNVYDSGFRTSRIVNYGSYIPDAPPAGGQVVAVESIADEGQVLDVSLVQDELLRIFPDFIVRDSFQLSTRLRVPKPSLSNARASDLATDSIQGNFRGDKIRFCGMRTDKGVFFSHHTIGEAHRAALEL